MQGQALLAALQDLPRQRHLRARRARVGDGRTGGGLQAALRWDRAGYFLTLSQGYSEQARLLHVRCKSPRAGVASPANAQRRDAPRHSKPRDRLLSAEMAHATMPVHGACTKSCGGAAGSAPAARARGWSRCRRCRRRGWCARRGAHTRMGRAGSRRAPRGPRARCRSGVRVYGQPRVAHVRAARRGGGSGRAAAACRARAAAAGAALLRWPALVLHPRADTLHALRYTARSRQAAPAVRRRGPRAAGAPVNAARGAVGADQHQALRAGRRRQELLRARTAQA